MIFKADLELFVRFFQYPRNSRSFRCLNTLIPKQLSIWYSDIIWYPSIRMSLSDKFKMNFRWMEIHTQSIACMIFCNQEVSFRWMRSHIWACQMHEGARDKQVIVEHFQQRICYRIFLNINKHFQQRVFVLDINKDLSLNI